MNPNVFAKKVTALAKAWKGGEETAVEAIFSLADRKMLGKQFPLGAALVERLLMAYGDLASAESEITFHLDLLCTVAGVPLASEDAEGSEAGEADEAGDVDAAAVIDDKALADALAPKEPPAAPAGPAK